MSNVDPLSGEATRRLDALAASVRERQVTGPEEDDYDGTVRGLALGALDALRAYYRDEIGELRASAVRRPVRVRPPGRSRCRRAGMARDVPRSSTSTTCSPNEGRSDDIACRAGQGGVPGLRRAVHRVVARVRERIA